ncbi:MAG TPA: response regulator [Gemmatimonadales bacterium]|nr:response regulator [Gemmatimonadales bacterium]
MARHERRREEQEHEERYRQLVELAPDAILIHDGERIVLANAAAIRLAGATRRDQLVGLPVSTFLEPPYLKAVQSQLLGSGSQAALAPPVRDAFHRLDGSEVEVEVRAIAFMDRGRPAVHLVIRDISERLAAERRVRQVEERLQQTQRIEAVGSLAGGVAHEINNMMSVVLGFSELLLRDPELPAGRRSDLRHIAKAAGRAAAITGQLLSFSRRGFSEPRVVNLGAAVRDSEPILRRVLGESHRVAMSADASPHVRIDPRQLDQVIVNLALNARDAMSAGGTLTVRVEETEVNGGVTSAGGAPIPAGRYGLLYVRDTGVGMDRATQGRIFEPFFTTKPVGAGTGLGLAAAYGIVKQNGGFITVASAPGDGSEFSLYLPVVPETADRERAGVPTPVREDARAAASTILVVEDEEGVRAVATRTLELHGFRVLEATHGADALELVGRHGPPDLVLTDVIMPVMGGAELAGHLRGRWPALPILFMSGYATADLVRQGALEGESVTVHKPFTPDALVRSVAAALGQQRR